jgi:CDP-6-deoxy-D-xylo-4-hexulose-3-dehydrase
VDDSPEVLRAKILELVREYARVAFPQRTFFPGVTPVPVAGKVFDEAEVASLVDASLDFWLTTGRFAATFERRFAEWMGVRSVSLVNSGSSANLVAMSALTSSALGERRLVPGDEVITVAAGFPTTVNPILQNGLVPVYVDTHVPTYNVDASQLEAALSPRTRAIVLAHTLGNPFDLDAVMALARRHQLWVIEDTCDALGATYGGQKVGTFGDLSTTSFYPAHHITMGEGGAVMTNQPRLRRIAESFRDWGRDCWCEPGHDDTCGKRFGWQLGSLPAGYDHKYVYSHIGYNLKLTDMQAAVGVAQLEKLDEFVEVRRRNFARLRDALLDLEDVFVLPEATPGSEPSWFGFPLAVREGAPFDRGAAVRALEGQRIATRLLFGGNLLHQPAYQGHPHRVAGELRGADFVMHRVFWVGLYPGLDDRRLEHVVDTLRRFVHGNSTSKGSTAEPGE